MSANDLQSCAGAPDKSTKLNADTQVYSYDYKPPASGGVNLTLPLTLGGIAFGGGASSCRANFRLVDNRVTEVHYTGEDDPTIGKDGVCEPLIRGCLRQPEPTMRSVTAAAQQASPFRVPPVPAQPPKAEQPPTP